MMMSEKNFVEKEYTNLTIKRTTKDRLAKYGTKDMTWDVLVNKVLDELDECRKHKSNIEDELDKVLMEQLKKAMEEASKEVKKE